MFVLSTSGAKQTKVFKNEEPPKPGNAESTKEEDRENSKGKLKDISNTDKETKQTNVLGNKEPLKTDMTKKCRWQHQRRWYWELQGKTERYFKYKQRNKAYKHLGE